MEIFNIHLSIIDITSRQKIRKDTENFSTINQPDLINSYGTFYPTIAKHISFPTAY